MKSSMVLHVWNSMVCFSYNFLFKIHFLRIKEPVFLSVRKLKLGFKKKKFIL